MKSSVLSISALLLLGMLSSAQATTLTMDELPFQPIDGLTFSGVTFSFSVSGIPDLDANYSSGGPGATTYVQDPSIEGNSSGILGLDFANPTADLGFGVALSTFASLSPGFTVELFDAALVSLGTFPINTDPLISYTEGQFTYLGAPVLRAVIDFDDGAGRFAFDNLTFSSTSVPEPASLALLGIGLAGLGAMRRRRSPK